MNFFIYEVVFLKEYFNIDMRLFDINLNLI